MKGCAPPWMTTTENNKNNTEQLFQIATLLWVDDVVSCMEGEQNQKKALNRMDEFATKHKLKWGKDKCNIMRVGKHKAETHNWKIGDMKIEETMQYKYLGDVISSNGKNTYNLESRKNKIQATSININAIASSEVLNQIETSVLLELHEKMNITGFLNNSETWILNKGDVKLIEATEIQALKSLFDLPLHTPNAAITHTFGTPYTKLRIDQKQMIYLRRILNRDNESWTKKTLLILKDMSIGWYNNIQEILSYHKLPTDFTTIKNMSHNEWKTKVQIAVDKKNKERLHEDCHETTNGTTKGKTKTISIVKQLADKEYRRQPQPEILKTTKHEAKTIIIARYGMLQCGKNYKGTMNEICNECNAIDDENHRMNYYVKLKERNNYDKTEKVDFNIVFSEKIEELRYIIHLIEKIWNTRNAHGSMNSE